MMKRILVVAIAALSMGAMADNDEDNNKASLEEDDQAPVNVEFKKDKAADKPAAAAHARASSTGASVSTDRSNVHVDKAGDKPAISSHSRHNASEVRSSDARDFSNGSRDRNFSNDSREFSNDSPEFSNDSREIPVRYERSVQDVRYSGDSYEAVNRYSSTKPAAAFRLEQEENRRWTSDDCECR